MSSKNDPRYKNGVFVGFDPKHRHLQADPVQQLNDAYRLLKHIGWQCCNAEVHITDRVPLFRLGDASIRRNKQKPGEWIVEINGHVFDAGGSLEEITAQVRGMIGLSEPQKQEPYFMPEYKIPAAAFGAQE